MFPRQVEPSLAEDQPVHGDLDTVNSLTEEHRAFQQELQRRHQNLTTVRRAAKDVLERAAASEGGDDDGSGGHLQSQLIDLNTKWDKVCKLSQGKEERLDKARVDVSGDCEHFVV